NPDNPVNAIPPRASVHMQLRFVVGTDWENLAAILRDHLDRHGFGQVKVMMADEPVMRATRLDPDMPWVR
ncbi:M20 peptidase family dipeptidase, partial [Salmonella enterica]